MNQRTEILKSIYRPELAITVYQGGTDEFYLESHSINKEGKIEEGKPLLQSTIQGIVDMFFDNQNELSNIGGVVPESILSFSQLRGGLYRMVWYKPAEKREVHFSKELRIPSGLMCVPPAIYCVDKGKLSVYCHNGKGRPNTTTKLLRGPFFNVSDEGSVCLGDARVAKPANQTFLTMMKYWEDLFWLSKFSHLNGASNPTKTDLNILYKKLIRSKGKIKWPMGELKPSKVGIKSIVK